MSACSKCLNKISIHAWHKLDDDCADWDCGFCDECIERVINEPDKSRQRGMIYRLLVSVAEAEIARVKYFMNWEEED